MEDALYIGLSEDQYYNLSLAEFERLLDTKQKHIDEQNHRDYNNSVILSHMIVGRLQNNFTVPTYESLYGKHEVSEDISAEQSKANFLKFAQAVNLKMSGGNDG